LARAVRRKRTEVKAITASAPALPPLDEITFQQLLEAAYVIQEQREAREIPPTRALDATDVLALIADTQERLRVQIQNLPDAGRLIAERLEQVTKADGVAIGVIREDQVMFCTATGILTSLAGSSAPLGDQLPQMLQANSWVSIEKGIRHDEKRPIVFPIFHEGKAIGLLHLSFLQTEDLKEHQIRTCQVMAGLMGEAISRESQLEWKQNLATERSTILEMLEKLRPQLERMAGDSPNKIADTSDVMSDEELSSLIGINDRELAEKLEPPDVAPSSRVSASATSCQHCGARLNESEPFCEKCGAPQLSVTALETEIQEPQPLLPLQTAEAAKPGEPEIKKAEDDVRLSPSLEEALARFPVRDFMSRFQPRVRPGREEEARKEPEPEPVLEQKVEEKTPQAEAPEALTDARLRDGSVTFEIRSALETAPNVTQPVAAETKPPAPVSDTAANGPEAAETPEPKPTSENALVPAPPATPMQSHWTSAANAQRWLESIQNANSPGRVWLNKHRADLWVVVSIILLLLALSGWGSRTVIYGAAQTRVVQPSLTMFERILVDLGLAEPPPTQVYLGNPNANVWVDLHTALYYCSTADLYGKTAEGKFTTQRDAQLDHFEPAGRRYCQ
jgi:hypothetical protein